MMRTTIGHNYKFKLSATVISLLLILLMSCGLFTASTVSADAFSLTGRAAKVTACGDCHSEAPQISAKACILYSEDLERVMYSKNADAKYAPYSITKLVTATIAAENLDMDQTVTISKKAADDLLTGTTMSLCKGEKLTVENLMYGALLLSGNDAAYALAEATSGSEASFVRKMNETVAAWGCTNTHFVNPSGIDDKDHYTTANDLLIIAKHAFANETVHKIATTRKYTMGATNKSPKRVMKNHTTLIENKNSGVLGGKTGFWDEQHATVALEYNKHELTAILILLKDTEKGRVKDAKAMLKYAHEVTPGFRVGTKGECVAWVWVRHGEKLLVRAELSENVYAYPKNGRKGCIKTKFVKAGKAVAPLKKGDKLGTLEVRVNNKLVANKDVVAGEDVAVR